MPNQPSIDQAARQVVRAWLEPRPHPDYHLTMQDRLRMEWPVLAEALEVLAAAVRAQERPPGEG